MVLRVPDRSATAALREAIMLLRRHPTIEPVVIDAAALHRAALSPGALGVFVMIAASPGGVSRESLLKRCNGNAGALDARLGELRRFSLIEGDGR
jgi:hypothetical protein